MRCFCTSQKQTHNIWWRNSRLKEIFSLFQKREKNFSTALWQEAALIISVQELQNYNLMSKVQTGYEASNKTNHKCKVQPVKTEKNKMLSY